MDWQPLSAVNGTHHYGPLAAPSISTLRSITTALGRHGVSGHRTSPASLRILARRERPRLHQGTPFGRSILPCVRLHVDVLSSAGMCQHDL